MSGNDDIDIGHDDDGRIRVAEYVLGVLDGPEREAVARSIATDPALAEEAHYWERQLAAFNIGYKPVTPPPGLLARVEARLFAQPASAVRASIFDSLAFWRAAAGFAAMAAIVAIGLYAIPPAPQPSAPTLVTALQADETGLSLVTLYDPQTQAMRLLAQGATAGTDNDYELWLVPSEGDPISFGIFAPGDPITIALGDDLANAFGAGTTLAVSLEPSGGSPTGAPTGPILAAGTSAAI